MSETKKSKKEFQYQSRVIVLGEIDDENVNNFRKLRHFFNHGDLDEADRVMAGMEETNRMSL